MGKLFPTYFLRADFEEEMPEKDVRLSVIKIFISLSDGNG
jgi:hypothetical protein